MPGNTSSHAVSSASMVSSATGSDSHLGCGAAGGKCHGADLVVEAGRAADRVVAGRTPPCRSRGSDTVASSLESPLRVNVYTRFVRPSSATAAGDTVTVTDGSSSCAQVQQRQAGVGIRGVCGCPRLVRCIHQRITIEVVHVGDRRRIFGRVWIRCHGRHVVAVHQRVADHIPCFAAGSGRSRTRRPV